MSNDFSKQPVTNSPEQTRKKLPWNWVEALLIGALSILGADILLGVLSGLISDILQQIPLLAWVPSALGSDSIGANFIFYGLSRLLGFSLIVWFVHRRGVNLRQFGFKRFKVGQALALILAASGILLAATIIVFLVVKGAVPTVNLEQEQEIIFSQASTTAEIAMAFLALVVIAPIVEESIFRGLMLPVFAARFGIVAAAIVTSAAFGAIHWQLNVSIVTGIMGLLLAWLYYRTRSLWPAIMFHSLKNLVAFILLIFYS